MKAFFSFPNPVNDKAARTVAAVVLIEPEMDAARLLGVLVELLRDPERRFAMGEAALSLAHPGAARRVGKNPGTACAPLCGA